MLVFRPPLLGGLAMSQNEKGWVGGKVRGVGGSVWCCGSSSLQLLNEIWSHCATVLRCFPCQGIPFSLTGLDTILDAWQLLAASCSRLGSAGSVDSRAAARERGTRTWTVNPLPGTWICSHATLRRYLRDAKASLHVAAVSRMETLVTRQQVARAFP